VFWQGVASTLAIDGELVEETEIVSAEALGMDA
jgi:hypothetical protein